MSSPHTSALSSADFVSGDFDALAMHMRDCAQAHGRMAAVKSGLLRMHSLAAGRVVTFAVGALILALGVVAVA